MREAAAGFSRHRSGWTWEKKRYRRMQQLHVRTRRLGTLPGSITVLGDGARACCIDPFLLPAQTEDGQFVRPVPSATPSAEIGRERYCRRPQCPRVGSWEIVRILWRWARGRFMSPEPARRRS
ncbi:hypothetical protein OBBRIDRAFT_891856 [Obba rivulosa]|uniref:Uncharacterized protein n=1 Tax=Obba rivulosa TaxID=1052685 RepID=A0A8E2AL90_9APHY|nr:hypothetical protein OBBRIDRAFT_891856 [Obba rivulosa]